MAKKSAIPESDWDAIRTEYVSSSISIRELAEKYKCSADALEKRANTQSWTEQRRKISAEVLAKADAEITARRAEELSEYNKQDLKIAKALRAQIATHINNAMQSNDLLTPREIKMLVSAMADAQKIGRLALGVSTSNNEHTGAGGLPLIPVLDVHFVD
jgi:DNA-binding MurR/RpiR family transcriptional regulator